MNLRNLADLYDDSRNHHTITNHNAIPVRGIHGRGMDFNGINAYLDCGNHSSLNITDAITIEAWVKYVDIVDRGIIIKGTPWADWSYQLKINSGKYPQFSITDTGSEVGGTPCASTDLITANEWMHIIGTYDGQNLKIYMNGILKRTVADTDGIATSVTSLFIGNDGSSLAPHGTIDELSIYNYALDVDIIKLHYRQQSPYYQEEAPTICL